jgi:glycosyltransferase involved in cell wall biosynthesis
MHIVLVNQYYAPDDAPTAVLLADLGERLVQDGHEVTAVSSRRAYTEERRLYPRRERRGGVEIRRIGSTGFGRGTRLSRMLDYVTFLCGAGARLLFLPKPDVVISLTTPPLLALPAWLAARVRGARMVYWVMDVYPDLAFELGVLRPTSLTGRALRRISRWILQRADLVIALGRTMAERLAASGAHRISVVHNWADGEAIRPRSASDHPMHATWGWGSRVVVMYSGNMGLAHEFETILDAADILREDPHILFTFVGGGPRKKTVELAVARRRLHNVEFRPFVAQHELAWSLSGGDVHLVTLGQQMAGLLVPSKIYGILAAGRPTIYIGPRDGEIPEIVEAGDCGVCVDLGVGPALAREIREYATDPKRRIDEGRRARELFDRRFTKKHSLDELVRLIDS